MVSKRLLTLCSAAGGADLEDRLDQSPDPHPSALLAPLQNLNMGNASVPKPVRICIWVPTALLSEVDKINSQINEQYGLSIQRSDTFRIALQAFVRNAMNATEPYEIVSLTDLENAFSGIGRRKTAPTQRSSGNGNKPEVEAPLVRVSGREGEEP